MSGDDRLSISRLSASQGGGPVELRAYGSEVAGFHHSESLVGVLGISMPREVMGFRRTITPGATIDDARAVVAEQDDRP